MYRNYCVTSDVQFRKGASIPLFWVALLVHSLIYSCTPSMSY